MPKIKPTSKADRAELRCKLGEKDKKTFDELAQYIKAPKDELAWHYKVGQLAHELHSVESPKLSWSKIEKALGPSVEFFQKAIRFTTKYAAEDVQGLTNQGFNWTRLSISFAVKKKKERHALLREAIKDKWTDKKLRLTIRDRFHKSRRGSGGRPRKVTTPYGPMVALSEMNRLSQMWIENHKNGWKPVTDEEWEKLLQGRTAEQLEKLLTTTVKSVQELSTVCTVVEGKLTGLLTEVKKQS